MAPVKLYWYKKEYNFGDILNTLLFEKYFNTPFTYSKATKCDCMAIGSIMTALLTDRMSIGKRLRKFFTPPVKIWGSGFICPDATNRATMARKLDVYAVRGTTTLARMEKYIGKPLPHVVLGDPGLLASKLYNYQDLPKKYELGIIPHYVDQNNPLLKNINVENSIVIDVTQPVEQTLKQIAQCKHIISSAMHGLIVADSFGIPNIRMVLSDKIMGGDYKFIDYYSAFDMEMPTPVIMTPETQITDTEFIRNQYKVPYNKVQEICDNLIQAFPYKRN